MIYGNAPNKTCVDCSRRGHPSKASFYCEQHNPRALNGIKAFEWDHEGGLYWYRPYVVKTSLDAFCRHEPLRGLFKTISAATTMVCFEGALFLQLFLSLYPLRSADATGMWEPIVDLNLSDSQIQNLFKAFYFPSDDGYGRVLQLLDRFHPLAREVFVQHYLPCRKGRATWPGDWPAARAVCDNFDSLPNQVAANVRTQFVGAWKRHVVYNIGDWTVWWIKERLKERITAAAQWPAWMLGKLAWGMYNYFTLGRSDNLDIFERRKAERRAAAASRREGRAPAEAAVPADHPFELPTFRAEDACGWPPSTLNVANRIIAELRRKFGPVDWSKTETGGLICKDNAFIGNYIRWLRYLSLAREEANAKQFALVPLYDWSNKFVLVDTMVLYWCLRIVEDRLRASEQPPPADLKLPKTPAVFFADHENLHNWHLYLFNVDGVFRNKSPEARRKRNRRRKEQRRRRKAQEAQSGQRFQHKRGGWKRVKKKKSKSRPIPGDLRDSSSIPESEIPQTTPPPPPFPKPKSIVFDGSFVVNNSDVSIQLHKRKRTSATSDRSAFEGADEGFTRDPNGRSKRTGTGAWVGDVDRIPDQVKENFDVFPDHTIVAAIDFGWKNVATWGWTTLGKIRAAGNLHVYDKNPLDNPLLYDVEEVVAVEVDGVVMDPEGRPLLAADVEQRAMFGGTTVWVDDPMLMDTGVVGMDRANMPWVADDVEEKVVDGCKVYYRKVNKGNVKLTFGKVTAGNIKRHTGAARREKETAEKVEQVFGRKDPFANLGSPRTCVVSELEEHLRKVFEKLDRVWKVTLDPDIVKLRFKSYIDKQRFYQNTLPAWVVGGKENLRKPILLYPGAASLVFKNQRGNMPASVRKCRRGIAHRLNPGMWQFAMDTGEEYTSQVHAAAHSWDHPERSLVCINHAEDSPGKRPRDLQRCQGTTYCCGGHVARDKNSVKDIMSVGLSNVVFGKRPTIFTYEYWRNR
ncbi:hypothetical protein DFJ74DRAFT_692449 [Hyaloraphidium curvatum]|nr:hypothetical protein DFJ74DRAFT_692449 [Hyaloraphidium curvatum]